MIVAARFALLAAVVSGVSSQSLQIAIPQNEICATAIYQVYSDLSFAGNVSVAPAISACRNPLKVASIYAATKTYCKPEDVETAKLFYAAKCAGYGSISMISESEVAENLTEDAVRNMRVVSKGEMASYSKISTPVLISKTWFDVSFNTIDAFQFEKRIRPIYGFALYGFWAGVILVGILHRLFCHFWLSRYASSSPEPIKAPEPVLKAYLWLRRHVLVRSLVPPYHRRELFWCTIPTRAKSLVVFAYWAISIILCSVNYKAFQGNLTWPKVEVQLWRYIADRLATMCLSNLPILWLFSGRNNIFIWATGWQFSTFNLFHRHVARVTMLQAAIHGISNTVFIFETGTEMFYKLRWKELWFRYGVVAVVSLGLMILFSNHWFRHRFYDSFLLIHISLAVVALVGIFYHTSVYMGKFDPYLWPVVAIWSFERGVRLVRIIYCNLHVRFGKGGSLQRTRARVAYDKEADIISVQMSPATTLFKPAPGQHYFLYQPYRLKGWESHPFTLAHWESSSGSNHASTSLSFWIKPRDGWTRSLKKRCLRSSDASVATTILLEGPYGRQEPLWAYDEVLLIAGGSGISAVVPYLLDHVRRAADVAENGNGRLRTRRITLVWANRSGSYIQQVASNELAEAMARADVQSQFYTTSLADSGSESAPVENRSAAASANGEKEEGPSHAPHSAEGEIEKQAVLNNQLLPSLDIAVQAGRPELQRIIEQASNEAQEAGTRLAIMACGPAGMVDETRESSYRCMSKGGVNIEYLEEAFGW